MIVILALLLFAITAQAEPWIAHAQSTLYTGSNTDPQLNHAGLIGEVQSLPYRVPPGKVLKITAIGLESFATAATPNPIFVLFPWITPDLRSRSASEINNAALLSCAASDHTNVCPVEYYVPAGMWVHATLLLGSPAMSGGVWAWFIAGDLRDGGEK